MQADNLLPFHEHHLSNERKRRYEAMTIKMGMDDRPVIRKQRLHRGILRSTGDLRYTSPQTVEQNERAIREIEPLKIEVSDKDRKISPEYDDVVKTHQTGWDMKFSKSRKKWFYFICDGMQALHKKNCEFNKSWNPKIDFKFWSMPICKVEEFLSEVTQLGEDSAQKRLIDASRKHARRKSVLSSRKRRPEGISFKEHISGSHKGIGRGWLRKGNKLWQNTHERRYYDNKESPVYKESDIDITRKAPLPKKFKELLDRMNSDWKIQYLPERQKTQRLTWRKKISDEAPIKSAQSKNEVAFNVGEVTCKKINTASQFTISSNLVKEEGLVEEDIENPQNKYTIASNLAKEQVPIENVVETSARQNSILHSPVKEEESVENDFEISARQNNIPSTLVKEEEPIENNFETSVRRNYVPSILVKEEESFENYDENSTLVKEEAPVKMEDVNQERKSGRSLLTMSTGTNFFSQGVANEGRINNMHDATDTASRTAGKAFTTQPLIHGKNQSYADSVESTIEMAELDTPRMQSQDARYSIDQMEQSNDMQMDVERNHFEGQGLQTFGNFNNNYHDNKETFNRDHVPLDAFGRSLDDSTMQTDLTLCDQLNSLDLSQEEYEETSLLGYAPEVMTEDDEDDFLKPCLKLGWGNGDAYATCSYWNRHGYCRNPECVELHPLYGPSVIRYREESTFGKRFNIMLDIYRSHRVDVKRLLLEKTKNRIIVLAKEKYLDRYSYEDKMVDMWTAYMKCPLFGMVLYAYASEDDLVRVRGWKSNEGVYYFRNKEDAEEAVATLFLSHYRNQIRPKLEIEISSRDKKIFKRMSNEADAEKFTNECDWIARVRYAKPRGQNVNGFEGRLCFCNVDCFTSQTFRNKRKTCDKLKTKKSGHKRQRENYVRHVFIPMGNLRRQILDRSQLNRRLKFAPGHSEAAQKRLMGRKFFVYDTIEKEGKTFFTCGFFEENIYMWYYAMGGEYDKQLRDETGRFWYDTKESARLAVENVVIDHFAAYSQEVVSETTDDPRFWILSDDETWLTI